MDPHTTGKALKHVILILALVGFPYSVVLFAHCDTMNGPVIQDARRALETGDAELVLKWVQPADENQLHTLFEKTLRTRTRGGEVQELVDQHFFETLVRVHRAGEGAPYTGLKPADTPVEPGIEAAEQALTEGSDQALRDELSNQVRDEVHARYQQVLEKKQHADESVEAGREYVAAYVTYIHYVEGLHEAIAGASLHGHAADEKDSQGNTAMEHHAADKAAGH